MSARLEGALIDTGHWRHFYVLTGLAWGLMAGDRRRIRTARIVADHRPYLMQRLLLVAPSRRENRILGRVATSCGSRAGLKLVSSRPLPLRPPRILASIR